MSQGLPVIAFNHQGIPEMLHDSCGYLVDSSDEGDEADAFAKNITDIIRHRDVADAKGKAARDKARSVLSWESKWQTLLPLYRTLCAEETKC
jgi:glycosyltransferase involved in cell wall biosynthesis